MHLAHSPSFLPLRHPRFAAMTADVSSPIIRWIWQPTTNGTRPDRAGYDQSSPTAYLASQFRIGLEPFTYVAVTAHSDTVVHMKPESLDEVGKDLLQNSTRDLDRLLCVYI